MNIYAFGPVAAALDGAYSVVHLLAGAFAPVAGAGATALAIVAITILVRAVLIPVGLSQARAQRMRRKLAPRLAELRTRHAKNPERLQRETMALYAEENASPFAGCLPLLIQAPILSLIYGLFVQPTINGHPNGLLTSTVFGAPLGRSFVTALGTGTDPQGLVVSGVILVLIAAIALASRRQNLLAAQFAAPAAAAGGGRSRVAPRSGADARGRARVEGADPSSAMLSALAPGGSAARVLSWLPLLTVVFAAFVPLAASLYLLVTTAWTLGEREILRRTVR